MDIQAFAAELEVAKDGRALELPAPGSAVTDGQRTALDEAGLSSFLASTLHEDGRLAAAIVVCDTPPRGWTDDEADLLAESAARAWTEVRRARTDGALRDTESRLRDTLDSTVDGLYRLDVRTGRFDYMSPSLAAMTGTTPDELSEMDGPLAFSRIHPDDQAAVSASLASLEKEGVAEIECRWALDGEYRWYSGVIRLTRDEGGAPLFQTGTFRDVTEHKRREQNVVFVSGLQDELAQVTSSADVIHATGTRLGPHLGVTQLYLAEVDPAREDGTVRVIWNGRRGAAPPEQRQPRDARHRRRDPGIAARARPWSATTPTATPSTSTDAYRAIGLRSWVKVPFRREGALAFVFCAADTEARHWRDDEVELLRDVTARVLPRLERARAEEARRALEERFRLIVTTASEGIALTDAEGSDQLRQRDARRVARSHARRDARPHHRRVPLRGGPGRADRAQTAAPGGRPRPLRRPAQGPQRRPQVGPRQQQPRAGRGGRARRRPRHVHGHRRAQGDGGRALPAGAPAGQRARRHLRHGRRRSA